MEITLDEIKRLEKLSAISFTDEKLESFKKDFNSIANLVIIPIQDYLELTNEEGRMNTPSTSEGNWTYRIDENYNNEKLKNKIKAITIRTNRN